MKAADIKSVMDALEKRRSEMLQSLQDGSVWTRIEELGGSPPVKQPVLHESTQRAISDLYDALAARLPSAMESGDLRKILRALDDAVLTALVARKTREEFDWKPHAIRAAEKIKRDCKAKKEPPPSVEELSWRVADELKRQGIRGRGGKKLLTPATIKRELLRKQGFKKN